MRAVEALLDLAEDNGEDAEVRLAITVLNAAPSSSAGRDRGAGATRVAEKAKK
jgi:hypothetical protein